MNGVVIFADNKVFSKGNEKSLFELFLQKKEFSILPIDNLECLEATIKSSQLSRLVLLIGILKIP